MPDFEFTAPTGKKITVTGPEGATPEQALEKAKAIFAEADNKPENKTTTAGQIGVGIMDPIEGGGQLLANILPAPVEKGLNAANNWLADRSGGLIRKLPEGGKNQQMQEREATIAKERGADAESVDWARMAGNMFNPINYMGGGAVGGASKLAGVGRAIAGGATAGALSPTDSDKFGTAKANQVWQGATVGTIFGLGGAAVSRGVEKIGEYVASRYPEAIENEAVRKILKRMTQDEKFGGPTATDALDLINNAKKPTTLTDVGGSNVRGLAGNVARQPGESKQLAQSFLEKRDNEAAQRLSADIAEHVTSGPTAHQATEAMLQARSAASRPLYDNVHEIQGVWSPRLERFLEDPALKAGLARGYELERMMAVAEDRPLSTTQLGIDLDTEGNIKMLDKPNMRLLDMGKRGLDAMIGDERNEITGKLTARGVALDKMRKAYVETLDGLDKSGTYKKARETWAGYSKAMDAVRIGKTAFGGNSAEENAKLVAEMSPSEREFARIGLADLMKERLGKTGFSGDEAKSLIKNPWMRDQMKPFFKTEADFNNFVDAVTAERNMFETGRKVLGGSDTAGRVAEDVEGSSPVGGIAKAGYEAVRGHIFKAAKTTWGMIQDLGVDPKTKRELDAKISEILFSESVPKDSPIYKKLVGQMGLKNKVDPKFEQASDASSALWTGGGIAGATHENPNPAEVTPQ